jgi:hypothetical protein
MALEAGVDGPGEDGDLVGARRRGAEQGIEPPRPHLDVVVDEADKRRVGGLQRAVARGVQAARRLVAQVARAVALGGRAGRLVGAVVDHDDVRSRGAGLRDDRRQRDLEVGRAALCRDDDGSLHGMGTLALPRP